MEQFVDNFLNACATENKNERKQFLEVAREGLSLLEFDAPALKEALEYSWNRGIPQIDLSSHNVGTRVHKVEENVESGNIVIFDFGLGYSQLVDANCWKILNQKANGIKLKTKDYILKYDKKVERL